jgi:hypothetical protein
VTVHPRALDAARSARRGHVAASAGDAVGTADAVIAMTSCAEYMAPSPAGRRRATLVVDCWRLVDAQLNSDRLRILNSAETTPSMPHGAADARPSIAVKTIHRNTRR